MQRITEKQWNVIGIAESKELYKLYDKLANE